MGLFLTDIKYILTIKIKISLSLSVYSSKYLVPMNTDDEIRNNTLRCSRTCMTCCVCPVFQIQRRFLSACMGWDTSGMPVFPSWSSSACWALPHRRSTQVRTVTHDFIRCPSIVWAESVALAMLVGLVGASVPDRHWSRGCSVWSPSLWFGPLWLISALLPSSKLSLRWFCVVSMKRKPVIY